MQEKKQLKWRDTEIRLFNNTEPIVIQGLQISTTYELRAVLITDKERVYDGEHVPETSITTKCKGKVFTRTCFA